MCFAWGALIAATTTAITTIAAAAAAAAGSGARRRACHIIQPQVAPKLIGQAPQGIKERRCVERDGTATRLHGTPIIIRTVVIFIVRGQDQGIKLINTGPVELSAFVS